MNKPLLNKLSPPPTKSDRDYYSKLDVYLKNLYEFTEQLNGVVDWVGGACSTIENKTVAFTAESECCAAKLKEQEQVSKLEVADVVVSSTRKVHSEIDKLKEVASKERQEQAVEFNKKLSLMSELLVKQIDESDKLKQELIEAKELLLEQQGKQELVLAEVNKLKSTSTFRGLWVDLHGVANLPFTTYHKGQYWNLLRPLRRIEAEEPSLSDVWVVL